MPAEAPQLTAVRRARARRDTAETALREAVIAAFNARDGYTVDAITEAAGLSRARIYQIVEEATP